MEREDNFISQTSNVLPQPDKSHVILDPVIAIDLAAPLPDLPALSLPENADAPYSDIITAMEASDNNEDNGEFDFKLKICIIIPLSPLIGLLTGFNLLLWQLLV